MMGLRNIAHWNMVPWHNEYLKLKESEKMVEAGGYFDLHPCPSEQELNLPYERHPTVAGRKKTSL